MKRPAEIRRQSADIPVVELRSPAQLRSDLVEGGEPSGGSVAKTQVLIREYSDNAVRWTPGERLNHLLEEACLRFAANDAVVTGSARLSYRDLNRRANQLARYLIERGIRSGDRIGLLFDRSPETYVAMLAVMKVNAAYVPLDAAFPLERIRFIIDDAEITTIVSMTHFAERLSALTINKVLVDGDKELIDANGAEPLTDVAPAKEPLCYIIYTSGTTGNPKGVGIAHSSICNFVRVAAELYGYEPDDRIYQGMTIAFDFSVEEIWVPLMAGATLVPARPGTTMMGDELAGFLREHKVSVLACCPTLLATIEEDLPEIRILLVGGEACPQYLVQRWYKPNRHILNSYGPTEATVTATLTELRPDEPVTIGTPLPTYSIVILDQTEDRAMARGETGEIGIAGIGLALGYMNRDELTMKKFIRDFLHIENNPSGRIYRTGDLGRIDENGRLEYYGRIDTQVKIRGYRIELNEIEAVLLDLPQVSQAAVTTFEPEPGLVELVAYYVLKHGAELPREQISQALRSRLPVYMVPAFLEQLEAIPMTLSNKANLKELPKPQLPRFSAAQGYAPPKTANERILHTALAQLLHLERVSIEHHFFDDLGANSLLMARFCAAIRKTPGMSSVSMRDIYTNPTIASLARYLDGAATVSVAAVREAFHVPSRFSYYSCGVLQLGFYAAYSLFWLWVFNVGYQWATASSDTMEIYARGAAFAAGSFVALTAISIVAKWTLIGRFKAASIPIWSFGYFRFWVVMTMMRTSPVIAFVGSPIYTTYLRMMGAKIGRNTIISSRHGPVCADMITIGDNTILRKDSIVLGYRAQSNFIHIGPVSIGSNAFVGEASAIDIDTGMGDNTQLGHASSLQSGQRVPNGRRYHGSPAVETATDYCPIKGNLSGDSLRSIIYSSLQLGAMFLIAIPIPIVGIHLFGQWAIQANLTLGADLFSLLAVSTVGYFGAMLCALAAIYIVPRLCMAFLRPGTTYPNFGFHYLLQGIISRISNSHFFCVLFGDSSFIVHHMRYVGWTLNKIQQTGSNMGTNQRHDNPFLCNIGSGTMVSDGLSMINMHMSSSSFQLAETKIGENNYLGNDIFYPPNGRTGKNVLLGTKTMIPIDGPVRENIGLLGSPAFEIPRMVDRDRDLNAAIDEETRRNRLRRKNAHNALTALFFLLTRWLSVMAAIVLLSDTAAFYERFGVLAEFAELVVFSSALLVFFVAVERASLMFGRLRPTVASIYDPYFWFHERHWKLAESPITQLFSGTPFRPMLFRAMGMKVGRMVFDCSRSFTERTLTEIGDYANLNEGCVLQAHSLEEGVFKSDYIRVGNGCSIGPGAFVHYGVCMADHDVLDADSFLMKGETPETHTGWRGNPAKLVRRLVAHETGHDGTIETAASLRSLASNEFVPSIAAE